VWEVGGSGAERAEGGVSTIDEVWQAEGGAQFETDRHTWDITSTDLEGGGSRGQRESGWGFLWSAFKCSAHEKTGRGQGGG